jgi:hypothetical protein
MLEKSHKATFRSGWEEIHFQWTRMRKKEITILQARKQANNRELAPSPHRKLVESCKLWSLVLQTLHHKQRVFLFLLRYVCIHRKLLVHGRRPSLEGTASFGAESVNELPVDALPILLLSTSKEQSDDGRRQEGDGRKSVRSNRGQANKNWWLMEKRYENKNNF